SCSLAALVGGCAVAPEIPVINRFTQPQVVTETVYVPIYVEVEKQVAAPAKPPEPIKLPEDQDQALSLLLEIARVSNGNTEEARKELATAQAAYNRDRSAVNRMRLALLSSLAANTTPDDSRLQALLEPLVAKVGGLPGNHPIRPVAEMLLVQLNERNRQVREQAKKVDELQQKLDALKAIEKQLLDRDRRRN
ncbi:MAG: hypothetical protein ACRDAM_10655, partial [Casimicrobium sp.]